MIRYKLTAPPSPFDVPGQPRKTATVFIQAAAAEEVGQVEYEGDPDLIEEIADRLLQSYGFRGRFIEEKTTPMDLDIAMDGWQMRSFDPQRIEGLEVLQNK